MPGKLGRRERSHARNPRGSSNLFKKLSMVLELKDDSLKQFIAEEKNVIVQFSAGWCGNCRVMKPKFKKLASETEGYKFVVVDAEKFPESRKMATVDNLPTFATFRDGELV